jgi:eukaryotic-like serine/threonine-protein kinase
MVRTLGRYEIVRPLARGGMAEIFLARDRGPGGVEKQVVIKCIRRERASDPRFSAMFVNEARLSMSLAHKNIASVFDLGRAGDDLFLVMEHVDGGSLGAALARAGAARTPPDAVVVAHIGLEACQALDYAHAIRGPDGEARSVVHRDVSPGNVLLSFGGEVKLVDFGVASLAAERDDGRVRGTPGYMSPEQARGERVDGRSDLWSLGACLWEALAGRRAFVAADADGLIQANKRGDLPPLPDDGPDTARPISPQLRAVIERATRADPADRFPDARTMWRALDEFLTDARAGAPSDSSVPSQHRMAAWLAPLFAGSAESNLRAGGCD